MPLMRSRLVSEVGNAAKLQDLLGKIKNLLAERADHVSFQKGDARINAKDLADVAIDETQATGTIEFKRGPFADVAASLKMQDLLYTAATAGAAGNDISIQYVDSIAAVAASLVVQDLTYTAQDAGADGNDISITYVDPMGNDQPIAVSVVGTDIEVSLATGPGGAITSTAQDVLEAIEADMDASALVSVVVSGTAGDLQTAAALDNLENGADEQTTTAGSEVVSVDGNAILVLIEDGASTAENILDAIEASMAASALVSVELTGAGDEEQAVQAATDLSEGADESDLETYDKADIVKIKRLRNKKWLIILNPAANPAA